METGSRVKTIHSELHQYPLCYKGACNRTICNIRVLPPVWCWGNLNYCYVHVAIKSDLNLLCFWPHESGLFQMWYRIGAQSDLLERDRGLSSQVVFNAKILCRRQKQKRGRESPWRWYTWKTDDGVSEQRNKEVLGFISLRSNTSLRSHTWQVLITLFSKEFWN